MSKPSKLKCNIKIMTVTKNPHVSLNLQYISIIKQIFKVRKL